jgi:hypothetical protein
VPAGGNAAAVAEDLGEQLRIFSDGVVHLVDALDDADEIVRQFETTAPGTLILKELQPLSEDTLQQLDFARSRLLREDAVVLVLYLMTLQSLLQVAPNLASFVEGFVATLDPDAERLSADEKEARLAALRTWAGRTDAEVIDLAERGQIPPDPAFAEWLVLPAPVMNPTEILVLFLHHLRRADRQRAAHRAFQWDPDAPMGFSDMGRIAFRLMSWMRLNGV